MEIIKVTNGPLKENCYILKNKDKAIVIDPGIDTEKIVAELKKHKLKPTHVLLTHAHFDHIYSVNAIKNLGAEVYVTEVDAPKLFDNELNMGFLYEFYPEEVVPNGFLVEGENKFDDQKFEVIFTPGHTSGSCVIVHDNDIFTGDTYFEEGVYGRCDLLDGHEDLMKESIKKLKPILKGKKIYPGHE